ncbi:MAG: hypothetical protein AAF438_01535 [Pseudomonadota bacterium]
MKNTLAFLLLLALAPAGQATEETRYFFGKFYTVFGIVGDVPPGVAPCGDVDFPPEAGPECLLVEIEGAGRASRMGIARLNIQDVLVFNDGPPNVTSNFFVITASDGDALFAQYENLPASADGVIRGPIKIVGGSGRFLNAEGKLRFYAKSNFGNGTAVVILRGKLRIKKDDVPTE